MSADVIRLPVKPRSWHAAEHSTMLAGWTRWTRPADVDMRNQLRPLRARARELAQNSDHVRHYLTLVKTNVAGHKGVKMQSRARNLRGGADQSARMAIEQAWKDWGRRGVCDVTGQYSWRQIQHLALESAAKDGEMLLRLVPGWPNEYSLALQVLDPESLDLDFNEPLTNGNVVVMGVELNEWRRPVAYWLHATPRGTSNGYRSDRRERIPAEQIIHGFLPEWVWQTRGVPWYATPMLRLKMLDGYEDAAVTAARLAASKMAFYKRTEDAPSSLEGERNDSGDLIKDAIPGGMEELPMGYEIDTLDWGWPNAEHGDFEKPVLRNIAAGLNVQYHELTGDLEGANYSSLREGKLQGSDVWRALQEWFIETLHERVYTEWLRHSLTASAISVSPARALNPARESLYRDVLWQPRGWQWVDPAKEVQAAERAIALGLRSRSSYIRERGDDPEEVWEELAQEQERMSQIGVSTNILAPGDAPPTRQEPEENADDQ